MAKTAKDEDILHVARTLNNVPMCEEYEKMVSGMLYAAGDVTLANARFEARRWCHIYNNIFPSDEYPSIDNLDKLAEYRTDLLRKRFGRVGDGAFIEPPLTLDYGANIILGERFYANFNLCILDCSLVTIGRRNMYGPNVSIFAATHETDVESRRAEIEYALPVTIGDDVWIGGHVVILPGVVIGDGVTVAAGSIVTKSIPSWCVVKGSPAKIGKRVKPSPIDGEISEARKLLEGGTVSNVVA